MLAVQAGSLSTDCGSRHGYVYTCPLPALHIFGKCSATAFLRSTVLVLLRRFGCWLSVMRKRVASLPNDGKPSRKGRFQKADQTRRFSAPSRCSRNQSGDEAGFSLRRATHDTNRCFGFCVNHCVHLDIANPLKGIAPASV